MKNTSTPIGTLLTCALTLAACGPGTTSGTPAAKAHSGGATSTDLRHVTYYKNIKPILDVKCSLCHTPGHIGPFTLTSYADVTSHLGQIEAAVGGGIMPPWMPAEGCNSYQHDYALSAEQKAAILAWTAAGGPEGKASDTPDTVPGDPSVGLQRVDLTLKLAAPYQPAQTPDEYRCFIIDWPEATTKFVTGFRVVPGNPAIVHHVIAFLVPPSSAASTVGLDGQDGRPGYACSGGSGVGSGMPQWLGAWAPGGNSGTFGPGDTVGTRLEPGSKISLQVHYHIEGDAAGVLPDQTSMEFQLADAVQKEGMLIPVFAGVNIAAGDPDSKSTSATSPISAFALFNGFKPPAKLAIYSVSHHMHVRGTRGLISLSRGTSTTCLLDIEHWNFHWQGGYMLQEPLEVRSTDKLDLECHWDNSAGHQPLVNGKKDTPRDITWGEGTNDEMCLGVVYMAPP